MKKSPGTNIVYLWDYWEGAKQGGRPQIRTRGTTSSVPISAVSRFFRQASIASMNKADGSSYMSNRSSFSNIPRLASPLEYSQGVLTLARRVRDSIRAIKPDAIVMGETTSGCPGPGLGGGLSADFAWLAKQNQDKMAGSPVRYGMPEVNFYSNGRDRNEFNPVFAAGYSLALLNANLKDADYIRSLVAVRQRYKDAPIHGRQTYQPVTGDDSVFAYNLQGGSTELITIVNAGDRPYSGRLSI